MARDYEIAVVPRKVVNPAYRFGVPRSKSLFLFGGNQGAGFVIDVKPVHICITRQIGYYSNISVSSRRVNQCCIMKHRHLGYGKQCVRMLKRRFIATLQAGGWDLGITVEPSGIYRIFPGKCG